MLFPRILAKLYPTSLCGSGGKPELSTDLIQSRNSTWPRSQLVKDNSQTPAVHPRAQDILSGQCGLLCLVVARASRRLLRDLARLFHMISFLSQHAPRRPAAPLLSIQNLAEGSKAILAFRLGLSPSIFADIRFKPSLLHLYQAQALSSRQTWGPLPACPCLPFASRQHPEHWQAWNQCLPRHCCLSFLERRLSLTWQGLSQPPSSIASLHSHAVGSLAKCPCHESNHAVGQGKAAGKRRWDEQHSLASRAVPSSCQVYHRLSASPVRFLLVSSPCLRCVFTSTALPRYLAYLQLCYIIQ